MLAAVLGSVSFLWAGMAAAQETELDVERFKPAVTTDGWVTAEGSGVRPSADPWEFGLLLNYGENQLVVVDGDGDVGQKFVAGRAGLDLVGSVTIAGPFALGLDLPFYAAQSGDADPSGAGLGDLRLVPKLRLLDDRKSLGLALAAEVRLPTHTGDFSGGTGMPVVAPKVILDHLWRNGIRLGFNVGALIREGTQFANVSADSEFAYAAALGYRFGGMDGKVEIGGELQGGVGLVEQDAEELPVEGFLFVRGRPHPNWEILGGPGFGVSGGYGVPTWRFFAGVRWRPTSHDRDHDGISDDDDECRREAEDRDRYQDLDGCPEEDPDEDGDGVSDRRDRCPDEEETINGFQDHDGCPDTGDSRVILEDGQMRILDQVRFEHGSAELEPDSERTLDQVALILKAHPEFETVRVEGHTDSTGPDAVNQRLSQERAETVRGYLIDQGVSPRRLTARGYGSSRPLIEGESDRALSRNRRVEFVIEMQDDD
jgi:outer membrane protein OmpA-like peptidoglycan-associated protein